MRINLFETQTTFIEKTLSFNEMRINSIETWIKFKIYCLFYVIYPFLGNKNSFLILFVGFLINN